MTRTLVRVGEAARRVQEAIERRDGAITAARAEGASLRQIAEVAGVSHVTVAAIVRQEGRR